MRPRDGDSGATVPHSATDGASSARQVVILRGISGAGKSSLVASLTAGRSSDEVAVCSADDYFATADGGYRFVRSQIVRSRPRPWPSLFAARSRPLSAAAAAATRREAPMNGRRCAFWTRWPPARV